MGHTARFAGPSTTRLRVITVVAIAALLAALAGPAWAEGSSDEGTWLIPAAHGVPAGAELVDTVPVADALVVRGAVPDGAATLDTELSWHTADAEATAYPDGFVDAAVSSTLGELSGGEVTGSGAAVALIDTGVADVAALDGAVAAEVNFTGEDGGDGYGHGTYMASLIAGRGPLAPGVAPGAGIVSLKVADAEGTTTLGQVLGAMQWLEGPGRSLGIRIASLSLGVDPDSPAGHLLDMAVDHLAATGVAVVTAAGNDGPGNLSSPATAPGSIAVGALDGDEPAGFSADGTDRAGGQQPEVLAPGVDVVGHLAPESVIGAELEADAAAGSDRADRLERGLLQGSGTSAAAALATGVAALVSSEHPQLDGADIGTALLAAGKPLDAPAALAAAAEITPSRPTASLDDEADEVMAGRPGNAPAYANAPAELPEAASRGARANGAPETPGSNGDTSRGLEEIALPPVAPWEPAEWNEGEHGWTTGSDWAVARWHVARWHEASWSVARWHVARWHVARWHADDWSAATWDAAHWDVARWHADDWTVARWHVARWHVARWHADDWTVARWHVARWHADDWNVARWHVARWHPDDWDVARWHGESWLLITGV